MGLISWLSRQVIPGLLMKMTSMEMKMAKVIACRAREKLYAVL